MVKDFKLMEFATIVENLENVVSVCNKENTFSEDAAEELMEVSNIITQQIYDKLRTAIGCDFVFKVVNIKASSYKR